MRDLWITEVTQEELASQCEKRIAEMRELDCKYFQDLATRTDSRVVPMHWADYDKRDKDTFMRWIAFFRHDPTAKRQITRSDHTFFYEPIGTIVL